MKKQNTFNIILSSYFISLIGLMLAILICSILKLKVVGLLIVIFMVFVIVGYFFISILKTILFQYQCSVCHHIKKMSLSETFFSHRADNSRLLKCPYCHADTYMERISK